MKKLISLCWHKSTYEAIPYDDVMSRQQFGLFRIFSLTAFIAAIGDIIPRVSYNMHSLATQLVIVLSAIIFLNYALAGWHRKLKLSYFILMLAGFLIIHVVSYTAGGVRMAGVLYYGVIILSSFMLLGTQGGIFFCLLTGVHLGLTFYLTEYTKVITYAYFENNDSLINEDYLSTGILAFMLLAAQSYNLLSSKNIIITRITEKSNELVAKNRQLQDYAESLEKTNQELDKFASIVSHDLKAPLRAIGNLTSWIEDDAGDILTGEVKKNFEMIKGRVVRMEQLINAILDYSKADRIKGEEATVDMGALIHECIEFLEDDEKAHICVTGEMPLLFAERTKLSQVFSNLISNAIKYCDKPMAEISIGCESSKEGWVFSVKDNGPGIDPRYHDKIFVIFQTLNRRDEMESTGVGLAIVKKIIEDHGGKIWVESQPGEGSNFKFYWPKERNNKDSLVIAAPLLV
jgi:signal transduction histidine kinase